MIWIKHDNTWLYECLEPTPSYDSGVLWKDGYVTLGVGSDRTKTQYVFVVDGRRTLWTLGCNNWVSVFFGQGPARKNLKGRTLWADRNVVLTQYGKDPRTYIIIAKREKVEP